jgi:hypothetical protein
VINAAGAQNPDPFATVISGVSCALAPVGIVSTTWSWAIAGPTRFSATLMPASTVQTPTFVPQHAGPYVIELVDDAGNVYTLQLLVRNVVTTQRGQAFTPAYVTPSQVETPEFGESLFCDSTNGGAMSTKDRFGNVRVLGIGSLNVNSVADMVALRVTTFPDGSACWVRQKFRAYVLQTDAALSAANESDIYASSDPTRFWVGAA